MTKLTTTGLTLREVKNKYPDCFYNQSWYDAESFMDDKPEAGTYEFDFTSQRLGNTYVEHTEALKREGMEFPHPAVLAEALCIHFKETGEGLMSNWYSKTSLLGSGCDRVSVGGFGAGGLYVTYGFWDDRRDSILGVVGVKKVDTGTLESLTPLEQRVSRIEKILAKYNFEV